MARRWAPLQPASAPTNGLRSTIEGVGPEGQRDIGVATDICRTFARSKACSKLLPWALLTTIVTAQGIELRVGEVDAVAHGALLHREFNRILAAGEGYPQAGPIAYKEFREYWLDGKSTVIAAWSLPDEAFVGSYFLKPNGPGRAAHVANAGYFVVPEQRGNGAGEALVRESMDRARTLGFDALQFNFVFETNPARSLYERLEFQMVGRVPDVIEGEAVCIYWRRLT